MDLIPLDTPSEKEVYIFNPTKDDFTYTYARDDESPKEYTIKSYEGDSFPLPVAEHLAKHLKDIMVSNLPVVTEKEIADAYKLIKMY